MTQAISNNNAYCFQLCCASDEVAPSRSSRYSDVTMVPSEYSCSQGCYDAVNGVAYGLGMVIRAVVFIVVAPFVLIGMLFQAMYEGMIQMCTLNRTSCSDETGPRNHTRDPDSLERRVRVIGVNEEPSGTANGQGSAGRVGDDPVVPLVRPVVNAANIPVEAVRLGAGYRINQSRKGDVPDPIDWEEIFRLQTDSNRVQVRDILDCFDRVNRACTDDMPLTTKPGWTPQIMRDIIEVGYVDFINARSPVVMGKSYPPEYYDQLSNVIRNLVVELRKPEISLQRKINVLNELADASDKCPPRRLSDAVKQYRNITNRPETMDNQLRIWLQDYKIDIIIRYFQSAGHMNVVNDARDQVRGWGLEDSAVMPEVDPYRRGFGASASAYVARLEENYTTAHLIAMIQARVEFGDVSVKDLVNEYFQQKCQDGTIDMDDMLLLFDSSGRNLNYAGAAKILELLRFIDPIA